LGKIVYVSPRNSIFLPDICPSPIEFPFQRFFRITPTCWRASCSGYYYFSELFFQKSQIWGHFFCGISLFSRKHRTLLLIWDRSTDFSRFLIFPTFFAFFGHFFCGISLFSPVLGVKSIWDRGSQHYWSRNPFCKNPPSKTPPKTSFKI